MREKDGKCRLILFFESERSSKERNEKNIKRCSKKKGGKRSKKHFISQFCRHSSHYTKSGALSRGKKTQNIRQVGILGKSKIFRNKKNHFELRRVYLCSSAIWLVSLAIRHLSLIPFNDLFRGKR